MRNYCWRMRAQPIAVALVALTLTTSACAGLEPQSPSTTPPRWYDKPSRGPALEPTAEPTRNPDTPAGTPSGTAPAMADAKLSTTGFGPLRLGMSETELYARGFLDLSENECLRRPTKSLLDAGISTVAVKDAKLVAIHTNAPSVVTPSGAAVGQSFDELKAKVGPALAEIPPEGANTSREYGVTSAAKQSLIFRTNLSGKRITHIVAYNGPATRLSAGGC